MLTLFQLLIGRQCTPAKQLVLFRLDCASSVSLVKHSFWPSARGVLQALRKQISSSGDTERALSQAEGERVLYEPIRNYLKQMFEQYGSCDLEITAVRITERAKKWLDDSALYFIQIEKQLPDLIGHFKPDIAKKQPYGIYEGVIIVEIKNEEPTLQSTYQTKLYAEVFNAQLAFLISSRSMREELRRFLENRFALTAYFGGNRRIFIGRFAGDKLSVEATDWYQDNPFRTH